MSELIDRSPRVSTLELFFDLVFVFTDHAADGCARRGRRTRQRALQVVVMLAVIWWMYDGYAWLTNAIATDLLRFRLLLLGGMGGFLVIALAIPTAYESERSRLRHRLRRRRPPARGHVCEGHVGLGGRRRFCGSSRSTSRPLCWSSSAGRGGRRTGRPLGCSPRFCSGSRRGSRAPKGFVIEARHFVERHGLVIIVALGESIVVIGAGAAGRPLDVGSSWSRCSRSRSARALWWLYFRDEEAVEQAMTDATPTRRARLALVAFGYWHYGLVLGVVAVAAGLKKAIRRSVRPARRVDRPRSSPSVSRSSSPARSASRRRSGSARGRVRLIAAAARARDDSPRHGVDRRGAARCADADRRRRARRRGERRHRDCVVDLVQPGR